MTNGVRPRHSQPWSRGSVRSGGWSGVKVCEEAGKSFAFPGINSTKDLSSRISADWKDGLIEYSAAKRAIEQAFPPDH